MSDDESESDILSVVLNESVEEDIPLPADETTTAPSTNQCLVYFLKWRTHQDLLFDWSIHFCIFNSLDMIGYLK
jgi:hypothetical protein